MRQNVSLYVSLDVRQDWDSTSTDDESDMSQTQGGRFTTRTSSPTLVYPSFATWIVFA